MAALVLSSRQRSRLRALSHPLEPVIHVGKGGLTEGVVHALDQALTDHELIKVQMRRPEDKKALAQDLAESAGAALCGLVGHIVILYRPHPETPKIAV